MQFGIGAVRQGLPEGVGGFLVALHLAQDAAAVAPGLRQAGVDGQRAFVGGEGALGLVKRLQGLAMAEPEWSGARWGERDRLLVAEQGLLVAVQLPEGAGLVEPGIGVAGLECQHLLRRGQRILGAAQLQLRRGEIHQGRDAARQQGQRRLEALFGGLETGGLEVLQALEEQLPGLLEGVVGGRGAHGMEKRVWPARDGIAGPDGPKNSSGSSTPSRGLR